MTTAYARIKVAAQATYLEKCAPHDFEPTPQMLAEHGEQVASLFRCIRNKTSDELRDLAQGHGVALSDVLEVAAM